MDMSIVILSVLAAIVAVIGGWHLLKRYMSCHEHTQAQKDRHMLLKLVMPSLLCSLLCSGYFLCSTYAWFNTTKTQSIAPITFASYEVTATVTDADNAGSADNPMTLVAGETYKVTLTVSGNAQKDGICIVEAGSSVYYAMLGNSSTKEISFSIQNNTENPIELEISSSWGVSAKPSSATLLENNGTYVIE